MKPLDTQFTSRGFTHTLIERHSNVALYARQRAGSQVKHYEVIRVKSHNGFTLGGVTVPPAETYPGAESWGTDGFTFNDLESAREKFQTLRLTMF